MEKGIFHSIIHLGNQVLVEKSPVIILFIIALLLGIGVSHPQFLINDEFITANQLIQLDQGHQVIFNEGKYGTYPNGTPNPYFQAHNNALGYPLILPLISLPAQKFIKWSGDTFDYWLLTAWTLLLITLGLLIQKFHRNIKVFNKYPLSSILILLAFLIFFLDMIFYLPFTISPIDAPREAAAIILTNDFLFAGTAVIIFCTLNTIFNERRYVWFGTFVCITGSSYLIWASSAKDHMLEIFLFSLIVFWLVKFFYTKKISNCFLSFLFIGLLAWDRPEIGLFLLFFQFIAVFPFFIEEWNISKKKRVIGNLLVLPFFTAIGAIPFFINNYIVTHNPFVVTYTAWNSGFNNTTSQTVSMVSTDPVTGVGSLVSFFQMVISWLSPNFDTLYIDIIRILFSPETGCIGLFILVPVFLLGLLSIPIVIKFKPGRFSTEECYLLLSLTLLTLGMFIAHLNRFHILNTDPGIAPDIRNLAPVYLALNLIGLIIMSKFSEIVQGIRSILKYMAISLCLLFPLFTGVIYVMKHQNENFFPIFSQLTFWISIGVMLVTIYSVIFLYLSLKNYSYKKPLLALIGLLIALPLVWQLLTVFLIANLVQAFVGYNFWLPIVREVSFYLYSII